MRNDPRFTTVQGTFKQKFRRHQNRTQMSLPKYKEMTKQRVYGKESEQFPNDSTILNSVSLKPNQISDLVGSINLEMDQ